jgi:hypothetical protein
LYDYRKARVTPLDWPAYKWPSIPDLAPNAALVPEAARRPTRRLLRRRGRQPAPENSSQRL